ncbi:MAG TPA: hypothetical protein VMU80_22705 [Bryobacteraceae bacterium]|nr:hypothetical protein [Bryobacteraceae bacterium]
MNRVIVGVLLLASLSPAARAEKLIYHDIKTGASGKIVPWYGTGPSQAYDHVVRLLFDFWKNMRKCPNGVPMYMQHQVWTPGKEDPRGLGGDQINMALSSWTLLYDYLGDPSVRDNMIYMADYWLAHGLSAKSDKWGSLPYPYNTVIHSGVYDGDMRAGKGFLQPDKAASFGAELVSLYKMTGNRKYLDAAVAIADTLADKVRPGDGNDSPWPFRVNAQTGEVHTVIKNGKKSVASYTSNYSGALEMFDGLIALHRGEIAKYARARDMVSAWLKAYPMKTNKWGPFFEDVPTEDWSDTEINADTLARYILEHPKWDPNWKQDAAAILDWSYRSFANHEWEKFGVIAINEQTAYRVPGNSHTSRHASDELLYCEKTGDMTLKDAAIRRLNWATYMVDEDGKNRYPRDDNWLTDGYGDYVRHFLRSMASFPELAPDDQNHLLRTTSVIQKIEYADGSISYTKFDRISTETLKLGSWSPRSVQGGTFEWNPKTKMLTLQARDKTVRIIR